MSGFELIEGELTARFFVFAFSAVPFTELRLALPIALTVFRIPVIEAYFLAVVGNIMPVIFLFAGLPPLVSWARLKAPPLDRFLTWWFGRVIRQYQGKLDRWGMLALLIFVAIPLPMTGAWTGTIAAYLFNLSKTYAFIYIVIGVMISGILVTTLTLIGMHIII